MSQARSIIISFLLLLAPTRSTCSLLEHRSRDQQVLTKEPAQPPLRYAVLGDSWASGVNYGPPDENLEYDFPDSDEICRCRRVKEAWPFQLLHDAELFSELDFQACHGAVFDDIPDQVRRLNQEHAPDFGFLMIGGNLGGFPSIVEDCIFQFNRDKDYGPEYPDPDGECFKTLEHARENIRSPWFIGGLWNSIYVVLNEPRIRENRRFRLFIVGYAGLFNHDDPRCNDWSFGIWPGKQPKLSTELRHAINEVVDVGRTVYNHLINHIMFNPKVRYIDINSAFAGHRFCEPTPEGTIGAQNANSWIYNLEWSGCWPLSKTEQGPNITVAWPQFCRKCGGIGDVGDLQRPCHPKSEGHEAIKNVLKEALKKELLLLTIAEENSGRPIPRPLSKHSA
jgi:hypothetical protein